MKQKRLLWYSISSGLLLSLGWFSWFSGLVLFFGFIPLLFLEYFLYENRSIYSSRIVFRYASIAFILWNTISAYWIYHATVFGAAAIIVTNSFMMSFTFWLFHVTHRQFGDRIGSISFIVYWTAFEHIFLNCELNFPWLNLGNGLAYEIRFIQWYEYTGILGGTVWLLVINVLLFLFFKDIDKGHKKSGRKAIAAFTLLIVFLPMLFSFYRFYSYKEKNDPQSIVILQPNIDPYSEKFDNLSTEEQLSLLLSLAGSLTDSETDYIVGPETAIDDSIWLDSIHENRSIKRIQDFIRPFPGIRFITGVISYRRCEADEILPPTARKFRDTVAYYEVFNSAIQVEHTTRIQVYHKSMLVSGVEKVPYPAVFGFMERFIIDLGGVSGSFGTQAERTTLDDHSTGLKVGTAICYESDFGEYFSGFIRNGARLMFVLTNDGWWVNRAGYRRHLAYSGLRAIETRRSIARSANTGISCFINQKGEILQSTDWWTVDAIKSTLNLNDTRTFYVQYGDYIGRISTFLSLFLVLYTLSSVLMRKKKGLPVQPPGK